MVGGMAQTQLSRKLRRAREELGLTLSQAVKLMPNTGYGTLQNLEGNATLLGERRSPPDPGAIQFKTVVDLVTTYWPAIQAKDIMPGAVISFDFPEQP